MNLEPIMEKICDLCHWPYAEPNEDGLKDECDHCKTCTIEAEIKAAVEAASSDTAAKMATAIRDAFLDARGKEAQDGGH